MQTTQHPKPAPDGNHRPEPGSGPLSAVGTGTSAVVTGTQVFTGYGGTPPRLHLAVSELRDVTERLPWQTERQSFGTSWEDPEQAVRSAEGEAVERFCGTCPPDRPVHGSYEQLTRRGLRALDPRTLVLHSDRQYATAGFPFQPFLRDSPAHWVEGRSAVDGEPVLVPAFMVYTAWARMPRPYPEPFYAFPVIGGIAAGPTEDFALLSGLEEVIERDAVAVWWANATALPALPPTDRLRALGEGAEHAFETRLVRIDNEFGLPVIAAGVRSVAEGWLTYGCAARADEEEAAAKALAEAHTLQITCRVLDDPATSLATPGRPSPLKSWRGDRRYLDDYRADGSDAVEQICQQQLYLDRRAADRAAPWAWDLPEGQWTEPAHRPRYDASALVGRVAAAGYDVVTVDLTTPEAAAAGMRVLRVVVPGTAGVAPAAYLPLGRRRMQDTAVRLGRRSTPLREEELNTFPMPHS
ncbi:MULTISPECIES: YcaO-like family protein [unclassified Streptomyces]|uniref:YcaO-like family protein n=1 Tax=unclassified Streptomyces TaxID=2593676 RepID=UPI002E819A81|nr:YcaO-like family protein [Streptomyces sp. NBC_00589]WTI38559.1 YcaO-like family protein [Streptomyces sp. NBC_00775]WUB27762.1 YcaO-like family protein [Streptomyces sp. NBC_00589]